MELELYPHRDALQLLSTLPAWSELHAELHAVSHEDVFRSYAQQIQRYNAHQRKKPPKGAQQATNEVIRARLVEKGWTKEPRLFNGGRESNLRKWKMDFIKDQIGVEIVFNHAEAMAWAFTRMHMAGESQEVVRQSKIRVGVAVFATREYKEWGRMDDAVGTYDMALEWLRVMRAMLPVPLLLVGVKAAGLPETRPFLGTGGTMKRSEVYDSPPGE